MKYSTIAVITGLLMAALLSLQPAYAERYGPIKGNETLWDIANQYRPNNKVSVAKMMEAFRASNPNAFVPGHPGMLKKGVYLEIPDIAAKPAGTQPPAQAAEDAKPVTDVATQADKASDMAGLQAEIGQLRNQLKEEQARSTGLAEQLKQLQDQAKQATTAGKSSDNQQVASLQSDLLVKLQTELADLRDVLQKKDARIAELQEASSKVAKQADTDASANAKQANEMMQTELADLKNLLEQRDTHIQNLQASLREASISIKRQFAENQALHTQLKTAQPDTGVAAPQPPAEPGSATPPSLTLAGAEAGNGDQPVAAKPVFSDQLKPAANTADDSAKPDKKPVSLQNILEQQVAGKGDTIGNVPTPSRVSIVVALISLMFVMALAWRAFSQQRALRQEEARLRAALGSDAA